MRRSFENYATLFSALGDETRLRLVRQLSAAEPRSIAELSRGSGLTRQAITKHLTVLETAGLVESERHGRETRFVLRPGPIQDAREYLDLVSAAWEDALGRLKSFVEGDR